MATQQIDAFILFNEHEQGVERIVHDLEERGISTYFWRRDIKAGEAWEEIEASRLEEARTVVIFLGSVGWGPNHLQLAETARELQKTVIPVLVGNPPQEAFKEAGDLFRQRRYVDLRQPDSRAMDLLVESIRGRDVSPIQSPELDGIIGTIRDGNESQRADVLAQIRYSKTIDRPMLSERLRTEISERFGPNSETNFASAIRDPKRISSIRSWLLSCLAWTDPEDPQNRDILLEHVTEKIESDRNVRFWALSQLYAAGASYIDAAAQRVISDSAPEVRMMGRAIASPHDQALIVEMQSNLRAEEFETVWQVLRVLRIVPIPELAQDVCAQLHRSIAGTALAYDTLYALSNPEMARAATPFLQHEPGVKAVVDRVLLEANSSDPNGVRNFTILLAALPSSEVDRALEEANNTPALRSISGTVRAFLRDQRHVRRDDEVVVAGYASDTIDVSRDLIDIREDVGTLAAVILAKEVKPPLAIGLFGDWGSGKSFFMQSIRKATERVAADAAKSKESKFCSSIVSIEFNAWHYTDTNLWASMVSYILEQLAAYVAPQPTPEEQQAALVAQLGSARAMVDEAEAEKRRTQEIIESRAAELQRAQLEREQKEIRLRDLKISDFRSLIDSNPDLKGALDSSLKEMGLPDLFNSASDLARVINEANTLRGRAAAVFASVLRAKNFAVWITLLIVVLVFPVAAYLLHKGAVDAFLVRIGAIVAEVTTVLIGGRNLLARALGQVNTNLARINTAKEQVDKLLAEKRQRMSKEEKDLQEAIAALKAKERESQSRLSAATALVVELEDRIRSAKQGRSLAQFLAERTRSEDYRKYLGLVSTIRQDFDALGKRLTGTTEDGENFRRIDRIVLYIDDLDRCPEEKVMEVLQAVHLLLAYPLFVVVVGVDPRWLLHSLQGTFRAFRTNRKALSPSQDAWQTTPQNYLEKIFQIPFSLKPMTPKGYSDLIGGLLLPSKNGETSVGAERQHEVPPKESPPLSGVAPDSVLKEHEDQTGLTESESHPVRDSEVPNGSFAIHEESLSIKLVEARFAEDLFALIPTPRAAKRFSNVYRILKAPLRRDRLPLFEGTSELPGEFQVPMLLLGILIGAPVESVEVFQNLWRLVRTKRNPLEFLLGIASASDSSYGLRVLREKIRPIISRPTFPNAVEVYEEWIPRVSRFSFDVGRAVEAMRYAPNVELDSEKRS